MSQDYSPEELRTWSYVVIVIVGKYISLCIFILGWITNILAIIALQTKTYRGTTTGFLLTAVAVADIGSVTTLTGHFWIWYHLGIELTSLSSTGCRLYTFCMFISLHISACSLALITVIRTLCVCKPFLVNVIFSLKNTRVAWGVMATVIIALDVNILWMMHIEDGECAINVERYGWGWAVAGWVIHFVLGSAGPFLIMLPCNAVIFTQIVRKTLWRRNATPSTTNTPRAASVTSTSVMCLVNSVAFIILTAPHVMYALTSGFYEDGDIGTLLQFHIFWTLYAMNSCINFLLYSVASRKFRQAFKQLVRRAPQTSHFSSTRAANTSTDGDRSVTQDTTTYV